MRKLYVSIEKVHIKGSVSQLTDMVTAMDKALQLIADHSDRLVRTLARYSATNKGQQYEKVVGTSLRLRDALFKAAEDLNDMQRQIVKYQNKILKYEGSKERASAPNPFNISKKQVSVETDQIQFNRTEMQHLLDTLKNYKAAVLSQLKLIKNRKDQIAGFWRDEQYRNFSDFIDDVIREVVDSLRTYDEYVEHLGDLIKEMS